MLSPVKLFAEKSSANNKREFILGQMRQFEQFRTKVQKFDREKYIRGLLMLEPSNTFYNRIDSYIQDTVGINVRNNTGKW